MWRLRVAIERITAVFRHGRLEKQLNSEIDLHLDLLAEQYEASGLSPQEARRAAQREFGSSMRMREDHREQRSINLLDLLWSKLRFGIRSLLRDRTVALVSVLSLGAAIGAATAVFGLCEAVLLRDLPFSHPERLVLLFESTKSGRGPTSLPNIDDWRERSPALAGISAFASQTMAISGGGTAERVRGGFVSSSFFSILDVQPLLGNLNLPRREKRAVISHQLWARRFQMDQSIVGKVAVLNGEAYEITGVLPASFRFPIDDIQVWTPAESYGTSSALGRDFRVFWALARLKDGVSLSAATDILDAIAVGLAREHPKENTGHAISFVPLGSFLTEGMKGTLSLVAVAVGVLLLAACANVSGILGARTARQQHQLGVRAALGASRSWLATQILTEGLLIGGAACVLGGVLAKVIIEAFQRALPSSSFALGPPVMSPSVFVFCGVLSITAGSLAAAVPALAGTRHSLERTLRQGSDRIAGERWNIRFRELLITGQVAAAMVLLTASGTLILTLYSLFTANLGFSQEGLLTMEYRVNRTKWKSRDDQWQFHRRALEGIQGIPGVHTAALARAVPFSGNGGSITFEPPSGAALVAGEMPQAVLNTVTADYFAVMNIPLLQGRTCSDHDRDGGPVAILINSSLAQRLWPDRNALGKSLVLRDWARATVVGIVEGNRQNDIRQEPPWQIYACYNQNPGTLASVVLRTTEADYASVAAAAQQVIWKIDGDQAVWKIRTMRDLVGMQTHNQRIVTTVLSVFALFACSLTLAGVFGIVSYDVERRTRELGIRQALGATRGAVLGLLLRRIGSLVVSGALLGCAASIWAQRLVTLFHIPFDPPSIPVLIIGICVLVMSALVAALLASLGSLRRNPVDALRVE